MPNVLAINTNGLISAFGAEARSQPGSQLVPIYDPTDFRPELTHDFVRYHTLKASSQLRRGLMHVLDLLDRVDWELHLPGYESTPTECRRRFEQLLASFVFARSYSINGAYRRLPPKLLRHS